jgi:hypothetical protein
VAIVFHEQLGEPLQREAVRRHRIVGVATMEILLAKSPQTNLRLLTKTRTKSCIEVSETTRVVGKRRSVMSELVASNLQRCLGACK